MRISKKILSVVLAVLMLVSVCMVPSSAAALDGTEDASKINVKYEVTQPESIYDGSLEAVDGNIYAVTVYAKAAYGINVLQVPLYFDADLFAPIMWADDDPWGNEAAGVDGWYDNNGEALIYDFGKGEAWSDTSWYRTNGNTATSTGNARFIGLGNASVTAPLMYKAEYVESTNTEIYDAYTGSPDDKFDGYMYCFFLNNQSKTAYMNGIANKVVTDYVSMMTIYFIRQEGVTAEECVGAEFGWAEGGDWLTQTNWDTSGSPSYFASTYVEGKPGAKYVSNAVVEAAAEPSPVVAKSSQIRFNGVETDEDFTFDVRTRAAMTAADFAAICGDDATAKNAIESVGFVYADSSVGLTLADAQAAVAGTSVDGAVVVEVEHIQKTGGEYIWTCLLTDAAYDDAVDAVGYITVGGTTYFFDAVSPTDFGDLYDTWYDKYEASLS